jgi:hypothetical protein
MRASIRYLCRATPTPWTASLATAHASATRPGALIDDCDTRLATRVCLPCRAPRSRSGSATNSNGGWIPLCSACRSRRRPIRSESALQPPSLLHRRAARAVVLLRPRGRRLVGHTAPIITGRALALHTLALHTLALFLHTLALFLHTLALVLHTLALALRTLTHDRGPPTLSQARLRGCIALMRPTTAATASASW